MRQAAAPDRRRPARGRTQGRRPRADRPGGPIRWRGLFVGRRRPSCEGLVVPGSRIGRADRGIHHL